MRKSLVIPFLLIASLASAQTAGQVDEAKKNRQLLTAAENLYTKTKAAFTKKPKDAKIKKSYVDATVSFGTITMNSPLLGPKEKYPKALNLYREALKADPKNEIALANKDMIEKIYKSMGRPIPK
ncbi:MAG: hypothetical protein K8R88_13220 [Armatimonadetes bacterium]|nr:hypothetical protein [Armatimonadota bacterium]